VRPAGAGGGDRAGPAAREGFFAERGFPVGAFAVIESEDDIGPALARVRLPALLKDGTLRL
jgi:hypothetical protein